MTQPAPPPDDPDDELPEPPEGLFDDDAPLNAEPDEPPRDGPPIQDEPDIGPNKLLEFPGWRNELLSTQAGKFKPTESNIIKILSRHPKWHGVVAFNEFLGQLVALKRPPFDPPKLKYPRQWTDVDSIKTLAWLQGTRGIVMEAGRSAVEHALDVVGYENRFHPPRDYFRSLRWDAVQRLPTWLSTYLGVPQSEYSAQVGIAWLISAIARVMVPGCQADYMLVLEGGQGLKKSTALRTLFGDEWFSDSILPIGTDEAYKKIQGKLCQEIAELESFRGKSATLIKAFLTARIDTFRDSFGRRAKDRPRTLVFAGTTNEREYLIDRTGNRRFWPVRCSTIDIEALIRDREQIWAEAVARYDSGEKWWLADESLARDEQRTRELREPWFELVAKWCERPTVPDATMSGRRLLSSDEGFTMADVLIGALNLRPADMERDSQTRAGFILTKLGYEARKVTVEQPDGSKRRERRYFRLLGR